MTARKCNKLCSDPHGGVYRCNGVEESRTCVLCGLTMLGIECWHGMHPISMTPFILGPNVLVCLPCNDAMIFLGREATYERAENLEVWRGLYKPMIKEAGIYAEMRIKTRENGLLISVKLGEQSDYLSWPIVRRETAVDLAKRRIAAIWRRRK